MYIIPVLDIQHGLVVRGIGGQRDSYRPIVSTLSASSQPLDVAAALNRHFGFTQFYLADLDAIAGSPSATVIYRALQSHGYTLSVDAGVTRLDDVSALLEANVANVIVGLESVAGPDELRAICETIDVQRIVFSLDLKHGKPLVARDVWQTDDPWEIAERAISFGVRELIVLDLANVGKNDGFDTMGLCRRLNQTHPNLKVITGGGIRGGVDLQVLANIGVDGVLIASALHDGRLTKEDVASYSGRNSQNAD